jgi:hypothetical protein
MGFMLERGSTIGSVVGGLKATTDLQTFAGTGLNVETSAGECMIDQAYSPSGGPNYFRNTSTWTAKVPAPSPTVPRVDLVVAMALDSAYHGSSNEYALAYLEGTATSGATLANRATHGQPSLPTSALPLAYILVPANATKIENINVENVAPLAVAGLPMGKETITEAMLKALAVGTPKLAEGAVTGEKLSKAVATSASLNYSGVKAKGFVNIPAEESRTNIAFGTMPTPDEVTVELPANGLILIAYQAMIHASSLGGVHAAIFLNETQLKAAQTPTFIGGEYLFEQPVAVQSGEAPTESFHVITTSSQTGLAIDTGSGRYAGNVTTGQILGIKGSAIVGDGITGAPIYVFANAGTYKVSVQFMGRKPESEAIATTATVKNRALWVKAEAFS